MHCPYCHGKMTQGYLQSPRHRIFWGEEKHKFLIVPSGKDISLSEGFFSAPAVESYCCQECRRIIVAF